MSRTSTKKRKDVFDSYVGRFHTYVGVNMINLTNVLVQDVRIQRTDSQGNPFGRTNRNHRKYVRAYGYDPTGSQDVGGPFTTYKIETFSYPKKLFDLSGGNVVSSHWDYTGRAVAYDANPNFTEGSYLQPSSAAVLDAFGATAIARCIPTNPLAGMGQFLGELHDLPKIPDIRAWANRARNFRNGAKRINFDKLGREAAGEYLG